MLYLLFLGFLLFFKGNGVRVDPREERKWGGEGIQGVDRNCGPDVINKQKYGFKIEKNTCVLAVRLV